MCGALRLPFGTPAAKRRAVNSWRTLLIIFGGASWQIRPPAPTGVTGNQRWLPLNGKLFQGA